MQEIIADLKRRYELALPKIDLPKLKAEKGKYETAMNQADFWNNPKEASSISQKAKWLDETIITWEGFAQSLNDLPELLAMAEGSEVAEVEAEIEFLAEQYKSLELQLFLDGEFDASDAILSLHVGNGGQDAEDFTQMLERMYLRWAEIKNFKAEILDESTSDAGLRSATIQISGAYAFGWLRSENGVHRLIRLSPFNSASLRQTSFARVEVLPLIEQSTEVEIDPSDLRIDVYRSSGAGGQSVNTTDSAVRVTYLPLNLVVTCQNERSQQQNKDTALKILKSRLIQLKAEQNAAQIDELRGDKVEAQFGSQIRTYTLQPYQLVKDHRTDYEETNPQKVFDGELDGFSESFLRS